jgi:hypothetical protein
MADLEKTFKNEEEKANVQGGVQPKNQVAAWKPGKHDRMVRRRVYDRFYEMADDPLRKEQEAQWVEDDRDFELYTPEKEAGDWRANFRLPDALAAIQAQQQ